MGCALEGKCETHFPVSQAAPPAREIQPFRFGRVGAGRDCSIKHEVLNITIKPAPGGTFMRFEATPLGVPIRFSKLCGALGEGGRNVSLAGVCRELPRRLQRWGVATRG